MIRWLKLRWMSFTLWYWLSRPWNIARCCTCGRLYWGDSFVNPWWREKGKGSGRRLACSDECAEAASPGCTLGREP
jgi:hypothetical protein